ncbi:ABC transporter permease [Phormidium sp. CCY1219]|uniref:ABC transporter permease n=1 Tax=Phormidium sp. CCY1219 TaxID=2886104 RepID=UPI002D1F8FE9|nr:ABC transporter permease [Phormidium sp. CCY1219]MEB3830560.1 ABC transporter permease [Phormidium sp. CCY1219]
MSLGVFDLILLSCDSLRGNPLRSALTTVGVFMGVAAVSATLQVRTIATAIIEEQLAKREAPQLNIRMWGESRGLRIEDIDFLRSRLTGVRAISASNWAGWEVPTIFQTEQATPEMLAVSPDFLQTSGRVLLAGRFFNAADFDDYRPVVAIDEFLAETLFQDADPIGKRIYADRLPFTVIGMFESKESSYGEIRGEMWIPLSLYYAMTGSRQIHNISVRPMNVEDLETMEKQIETLLEQRFPEADIYVGNNIRRIIEQKKTLEMASRALLAVGAIALLVGGVGIANITIAAVMERTPEIGLRRALGATQLDIMWQFILEAAILSLLGGAIAIGTVHGLTLIVADTFELPYQFNKTTAALALGSALLVGVGAGFPPALRASQLDPVQALRSR